MTVPVVADGDPVGAMRDLSGHGRHLFQTSAAARPTYKTADGLHWLEGDGTDDFLASAIALDSYPLVLIAGFAMLSAVDEGAILALRKDNSAYKTLMQSNAANYQLRATDRASATLDARATVTSAPPHRCRSVRCWCNVALGQWFGQKRHHQHQYLWRIG